MIRNKNGYINDTAYPLYYFGHGLSYTTFAYAGIRTDKRVADPEEKICISVEVTNTGDREGDEVVQLYFSDEVASMVRPVMELAGFHRISLKPGETKQVTFSMKLSQTAFLNEKMEWVVEKGRIDLLVGASSKDIRERTYVDIKKDAVIDEKTRGFYASVVCDK